MGGGVQKFEHGCFQFIFYILELVIGIFPYLAAIWLQSRIPQNPQGCLNGTRWFTDLDPFQSQNPLKTTMHHFSHILVVKRPDFKTVFGFGIMIIVTFFPHAPFRNQTWAVIGDSKQSVATP